VVDELPSVEQKCYRARAVLIMAAFLAACGKLLSRAKVQSTAVSKR